MAEVRAFTIESFYKFVGEGKLMAARCNNCGALHLPPRPACTNCFSKDLKWTAVNNRGKLLTYTIIHVAPKQFESKVPYPVAIVKLEDGPRLLGMIRGIEPEGIKVGMELTVAYERTSNNSEAESEHWPSWPKYYFKQSST